MAALQVGGAATQVREEPQTGVLPLQTLQAPPPAPHAFAMSPVRHWLPWQQPLPQFDGVHEGGGATQVRDEPQTGVFPLHTLQVPPPMPQAVAMSPVTHWLPWQQPLLQFDGVHCGGGVDVQVRELALQTGVLPLHTAQVMPPMPQPLAMSPVTH